MKVLIKIAGLVLVVSLLAGVIAAGQEPGKQAELASIIEKVVQRQNRIKSVRLKYVSDKLFPKGSLMTDAGVSTEDVVVQRDMTLLISGSRLRYGRKGLEVNVTTHRLVQHDETTAVVDGIRKLFGEQIRQGHITDSSFPFVTVQEAPLVHAYRLFDPVLGDADPEAVRLVGHADHAGHRCAVIECPDAGGGTKRWWLAEDQEYSVVQWQHHNPDGTLWAQATMDYEPDSQVGWRLASWSVQNVQAGQVLESTTNRSVEVRYNEDVDAKEFEITFPPGTRVHDTVAGTSYVVGEVEGVEGTVGEGSMEKFVEKVREEAQPTPLVEKVREEVQPTPSARTGEGSEGGQNPPPRFTGGRWLLGIVGVMVAVVALLVLVRKLKADPLHRRT